MRVELDRDFSESGFAELRSARTAGGGCPHVVLARLAFPITGALQSPAWLLCLSRIPSLSCSSVPGRSRWLDSPTARCVPATASRLHANPRLPHYPGQSGNPGSLGEKAYPSLLDVPGKIDIVNIFRRPEFVEEVVDQAIRLKVPAVWMQEGVIHEKAARKPARRAWL